MSIEGALTAISQPVNTLIEKIASGVGILYEPTRIRKNAKAQADANKIDAISKLEIEDIQKRALTRIVTEETIKQINIENVIEKAIPKIQQDAKTENVDNDWLIKYFEKVRSISDEDMQELWSKILAGECNNTGTFSKMTLNVVGELDKTDAILFSSLCSCVFKIAGDSHPIIYEANDSEYQALGINYEKLLHLQSLGLISFNSISGYKRQGFEKKALLEYYDKKIILEFPKDKENEFQMGNVLFTQAGKQLFTICESKKSDIILSKTLNHFEYKDNIKYAIINNKE